MESRARAPRSYWPALFASWNTANYHIGTHSKVLPYDSFRVGEIMLWLKHLKGNEHKHLFLRTFSCFFLVGGIESDL